MFYLQGLDFVLEIWTCRCVSDVELKEKLHSECHKWLLLLLQLIDVTAPKADIHLKQFIDRVAKDFKQDVENVVSFAPSPKCLSYC